MLTKEQLHREILNQVCMDLHLNDALDAVMRENSPDGIYCILGSLAAIVSNIALDKAGIK